LDFRGEDEATGQPTNGRHCLIFFKQYRAADGGTLKYVGRALISNQCTAAALAAAARQLVGLPVDAPVALHEAVTIDNICEVDATDDMQTLQQLDVQTGDVICFEQLDLLDDLEDSVKVAGTAVPEFFDRIKRRDTLRSQEKELIRVCVDGSLEKVTELVSGGTAVACVCDKTTPIWAAAQFGHVDVLEYLIEHGADVNEVNWCCRSLLFASCSEGKVGVARVLIEKGALIDQTDQVGRTPVCVAYAAAATTSAPALLLPPLLPLLVPLRNSISNLLASPGTLPQRAGSRISSIISPIAAR
jgi:hypothetical protein